MSSGDPASGLPWGRVMSIAQRGATGNAILDGLSAAAFARLAPNLSLRKFAAGVSLRSNAANGRTLHFPSHGAVADFVEDASGSSVTAAVVGPEGVIGLPLWLGAPYVSSEWSWVVEGDAWRLPLKAVEDELTTSLHRFAAAQLHGLRLTAACHLLHGVEERIARFLLEITDRAGVDELEITHERLAAMVGVTRPRITAALDHLERSRGIHRGRGRVLIRDAALLARVPCECYQSLRDIHDAVGLPWPPLRGTRRGG